MADTNIKSTTEPVKKKGAPILMVVITIILAIGLIWLITKFYSQKNKMIEMELVLTQEKDSLANELRLMMHSYDTLKTNNDSLKADFVREQTRIKKLLALNASNVQLIKKYKNEIGTMREIMKSYIIQIDSLNTKNKNLVVENQGIKEQISKVQKTNVELSKVKEELSTKVEIASVIQAKDIVAVTLNKKSKETSKIDKVTKLRVCFTLRENPLASAGSKIVYMRVLRPDSLVITTSPENSFDYKGGKLIFSANRSVDYINQDIEMCIFLDNTGDFIIGNYTIELYLENDKIGTGTFMLSKK
jgi:FtsZ-binding cell division protein ZapB